MPFRVVSEVGLGMDVLDFGGDRRRVRGSLGVASHFVASCPHVCTVAKRLIGSGCPLGW